MLISLQHEDGIYFSYGGTNVVFGSEMDFVNLESANPLPKTRMV